MVGEKHGPFFPNMALCGLEPKASWCPKSHRALMTQADCWTKDTPLKGKDKLSDFFQIAWIHKVAQKFPNYLLAAL